MAGVQVQLGRSVLGLVHQMAHQLVSEEVDRDAVGVAPRQLAPERLDIEFLRRVEVVDGDGEMEDVAALPHEILASKHSSVSARSPSRIVSRPRIAVEGMFPRLTSEPTRRTK